MNYRVSVDTGGTFTDVIVMDDGGRQIIGKALTTYDRAFRGMSDALSVAAAQIETDLAGLLRSTTSFIYGTTRATNAIVTRNVAKTAYFTTLGFPDVLVLKEGGKLDGYDFTRDYPEPYIPRRRTFEIPERISTEGEVIRSLDETAVREILRELKAHSYEAVAVCLLWSIVNPIHEIRVGELIGEELPGVPYSLSHRVAPIIREYRRGSATAIDASLKPLMQAHFRELAEDLKAAGYVRELLISTSVGGVMGVSEVIESPIHTAKSGPAMAPLAGVTYSLAEGMGGDMIVCDTGGTTFDVGLSRNGALVHSRETWLGGQWEGDLLGISAVDIRSVGAGGGSIAWVDGGGLLRVGPQSAGSEPGPACYGRGGALPTTSDAACVLGYFDPDYFLGGRMTLDVEAARRAVWTIAHQLGRSVDETAWGIMNLANDLMIKAIHEITVAQGINPLENTVVAGGGAAGMNIMQIAAELGAERVILPKVASALSASGMQFADIVKEEQSALVTQTNAFDHERVNSTLESIEDRLQAFRQRVDPRGGLAYRIELFAEARYVAQVWDLDMPLPVRRVESAADVEAIARAFGDVHHAVFAIRDDACPVEILNLKGRLIVEIAATRPTGVALPPAFSPPSGTTRSCYFGGPHRVETPIFAAGTLAPGAIVRGPAIVQEPTTTLVIYPGMSTRVSGSGNYILEVA